jgi:hypothetical protein
MPAVHARALPLGRLQTIEGFGMNRDETAIDVTTLRNVRAHLLATQPLRESAAWFAWYTNFQRVTMAIVAHPSSTDFERRLFADTDIKLNS